MSASTKFVQRVANAFRLNGGHDSVTIHGLDIVRAVPGRVEATLPITQTNLNRLGSVHGGLVATLVDTGGSLVIASRGFYATGVTTDLHATFVKPAGSKGDTLKVLAELVSLGRVMATTRIELRHPVTDALLAYGSHTKFVGKIHEHPENVEFDSQGETVIKGKPIEEWSDH